MILNFFFENGDEEKPETLTSNGVNIDILGRSERYLPRNCPNFEKITAFAAISQDDCVCGDEEGFVYYLSRRAVEHKIQVGAGRIDKIVYKNNNIAILIQDRETFMQNGNDTEAGSLISPTIRIIDLTQKPRKIRLRSTVIRIHQLAFVTAFDFSGDLRSFCIGGVNNEQVRQNNEYLQSIPRVHDRSSPSQQTQMVQNNQNKSGLGISSTILFLSGNILSNSDSTRAVTTTIQGVVSNIVIVSIKLVADVRVMHVYLSTSPCYRPGIPLQQQLSNLLYKGEVFGAVTPVLIRTVPKFVKLLNSGALPGCMHGGRYTMYGTLNDADNGDKKIEVHQELAGDTKDFVQNQSSILFSGSNEILPQNTSQKIPETGNTLRQNSTTGTSVVTIVTNEGINRVGLQLKEISTISSTLIGVLGSHIGKIMDKVVSGTHIISFGSVIPLPGLKQISSVNGVYCSVIIHEDGSEIAVNRFLGFPITFSKAETKTTLCCIDMDVPLSALKLEMNVKDISFCQGEIPTFIAIANSEQGTQMGAIRETRFSPIIFKQKSERECQDEMLKHNLVDAAMKRFSGLSNRRTPLGLVGLYVKIADTKYETGDYKIAMDAYIKALKLQAALDPETIASSKGFQTLDTVSVIDKYISAQQGEELVRFLKRMACLGQARSDHIKLLIILLLRTNGVSEIEKLVKELEATMIERWEGKRDNNNNNNNDNQNSYSTLVEGYKIAFDIDPIVTILTNAGQSMLALRLALLGGLYGDAL